MTRWGLLWKTFARPVAPSRGKFSVAERVKQIQKIQKIQTFETFIDFFENTIGLHVNGKAKIVENDELLADKTQASVANSIQEEGVAPERWIFITVEEAYIHCSKHIPHLQKLGKKIHWGTDKKAHKGGDFFKTETFD